MNDFFVIIPSKDRHRWSEAMASFFANHLDFDWNRVVTICGFEPRPTQSQWIPQRTPFVTAQAWNEALQLVPPNKDVVILSDDVEIVSKNLYNRIEELSIEMRGRSILSPALFGFDFNHALLRPGTDLHREFIEVPFVCPYIPRRILNAVKYHPADGGPDYWFDENYRDYGREDFDFCVRALKYGFRIYVASFLQAHHLRGESSWRKFLGGEQSFAFREALERNCAYMRSKFGFAEQSECHHQAHSDWAFRDPLDDLQGMAFEVTRRSPPYQEFHLA